jgi:Putative 2OG-Fe(II) oxygenase
MTTRMNIALRGIVRDAGRGPGSSGRRGAQRRTERHHPEEARDDAIGSGFQCGGWHSDREIAAWGGAEVAFILDLAKEMANRLTADRNGKSIQPKWSVMAWANVNGPGDGNICHYHPGAFWSGTYYVADGGCATDPGLGRRVRNA